MKKKGISGAEILYLQQDMRELELYSTVGTVYSVCDSLNYILEEEELGAVFALVNNYLFPGGIFIFDFNTPKRVKTRFRRPGALPYSPTTMAHHTPAPRAIMPVTALNMVTAGNSPISRMAMGEDKISPMIAQ